MAEGMDFDMKEFLDRQGLSVQDVELLSKVELRAVSDYVWVSMTSGMRKSRRLLRLLSFTWVYNRG